MPELDRSALGLVLTATTAASALWFALAWANPSSTYHFAPFVAALAGPYVSKTRHGQFAKAVGATLVAASAAIVAITIVLLSISDRLRGPTFWSDSGATLESFIFGSIGATVAFALLRATATDQ